jgi:phosphate-selective porin OprO and OprP
MIGGLSKINRYLLAGAGVIGILMAAGTSANAADTAQLEATLKAMQAQMADLQRQVEEAKAAAAAAQTSAANAGGSDLDLKLKWKGAPELSSSDGKFKFKVRGRIQTDYNNIDQDFDITGRPDVSAVELRRARLGVEGVVWYDVKYKFEVDFASGTDVNSGTIKDAYVAYAGLKPKDWGIGEIRFGNQYVYNSLEQITSSRFTTFMERAAFTEAFFLDRQIGAAILAGSEHWSFQTGIYGAPPDEQTYFLQDQTAYSGRLTVAPINREVNGVNQVLHFGVSGRHRDAPEDCRSTVTSNTKFTNSDCTSVLGASEPFRYRARGADLHLADRFVQTPRIGDSDNLLNLEAAFVWGSFSMQGEYATLWVDTPTSLNTVDPTYNGWYVDASWFITGETRNYEGDTGEFGRPKVKHPVLWGQGGGGWGAWQIAGRYDVLDLSDENNVAALVCQFCGTQETWLFGVNWWLNDYTRMVLNVTQSQITGGNNGFAKGSGQGFNRNDGAEITGVGLRAQVDW